MGGSAVGGFFRYLFNVLVARFLGIEVLGFYAMSMAVREIAVVLGKLGLDIGVVRYVARFHALDQVPEAVATVRRGVILGLSGSALVAVLLIVAAPWISTRVFHSTDPQLSRLILWFSATVPLTVAARILAGASQGLKVLKHRALALQVLPTLVLVVTFLALVFWVESSWSVVGAFIGSQVVSALAATYFLNRLVPLRRPPTAPPPDDLLRFSLPLVFVALISMLIHWSDIIMLGILTDSHTTGLYQPAARTAGMVNLVIVSLGGIFAPTKVILGCATVNADEPAALRKTLAYGLTILTIMAVLIWAVHLVG